jgi:hypothetical protein
MQSGQVSSMTEEASQRSVPIPPAQVDIIAQRLALYHEVTSPIISWYRDRGILVSVDAMRSAQQVGREILTALEAMRPLLDHVPPHARRPLDLTGLGDAFGATNSTTDRSG